MATLTVDVGITGDEGYWSTSASTFGNGYRSNVSNSWSAFARFTGLAALDGATITSASLRVRSDAGYSGSGWAVTIRAAAQDNASAPTDKASAVAPTRTTAGVGWSNPGNWTATSYYTSPDLTSVIQEMATAGYLASGVLLLYLEDSGGTQLRRIRTYTDAAASAARLVITYETTVDVSLADSGTVTATESLDVAATVSLADGGTITAIESLSIATIDSVSLSDSGTVTAVESLSVAPQMGDAGTVTATESLAVAAAAGLADSGTVTAVESLSVGVSGLADSGTVTAVEDLSIGASMADGGTVTATEHLQVRIIPIVTEPRIALDITDLAGTPIGPGPIVTVLRCDYSGRADEIGTFTATVPATIPQAAALVAGRVVRIRREGEGEVWRGILDTPKLAVGDDGAAVIDFSGQSTAARLVWDNTLFGRSYAGSTVAVAVADLLATGGWTAGTVGVDTISAAFEGVTIWAALRQIAQITGWHVIEHPVTQVVDVAPVGADSGLVLRGVDRVATDMGVVPVLAVTRSAPDTDLWNRIIPIGAGEGVNALTLRWATASSPYAIQSASGPDGRPYYYIEDSASIAAHGLRIKPLVMSEVAPLANSDSELTNAANTLYAIGSAYLGVHAEPGTFYEVKVAGLRHVVGGVPAFQVGQTARLQWVGLVDDGSGVRSYATIDTPVYVMGYRREFAADGSDAWTLEVATTDRHGPAETDAIVQAVDDLWALRTAMKPYSYREVHRTVESVDATHTATLRVTFDDNVTYLHQARLQLVKRRVKSNVAAAASGGTPTTSGGGGQTSQSGTPHTHSVTGQTAQSSGAHEHVVANAMPTFTWGDPAYIQQMIFSQAPPGRAAYGVYVGRNGTEGAQVDLYTQQAAAHSHPVEGVTSGSEGSHTHGITPHTHSIDSHTHPMTYGIYLGPTASTPQMTVAINGVDVTAALGGPWNADVTVDITPYLVDGDGRVLRQSNRIEIGSAQLMDVEIECRSFVTALSLVPV